MTATAADQALDRLITVTKSVAAGNAADIDELLTMAGGQNLPPRIAALAEAFGMLVVQVEAREFQLNCTISDLERTQADLEQANYDPLTGLPNRAIFHDRLRKAVTGAHAGGHQMAVMFLDLDHFKEVNDTLGHDAGDALLRIVAGRIGACVRAQDIVARLGGDEFTVTLPTVASQDDAADVARRIIHSLSQPVALGAGTVTVGASIGIALLPAHADTAESLVKKADAAMYRVKESGRNSFAICGQTLTNTAAPPARTECQTGSRALMDG